MEGITSQLAQGATQEDISISIGTLVRLPGARIQILLYPRLCSDSGWASRIQGPRPEPGRGCGAPPKASSWPQPGGNSSGPEAEAGLVNAAALGGWQGGGREWREGYRKGLCEPI